MKSTFSITEAQAQFPKLVRSQRLLGIARHNKVEAFLIPRERLESLLETLDLLADPATMSAVREHRAGKTSFRTLAEVEKELAW